MLDQNKHRELSTYTIYYITDEKAYSHYLNILTSSLQQKVYRNICFYLPANQAIDRMILFLTVMDVLRFRHHCLLFPFSAKNTCRQHYLRLHSPLPFGAKIRSYHIIVQLGLKIQWKFSSKH